MLKGLEITEISLTNFKLENPSFRFDSEYFQKEFIQNINCLKSYPSGYDRLINLVDSMTGGATPLGAEYSDFGIPFLRVQNIMQNHFNLSDVVYIDEQQNAEITRSSLKNNDVLLTITGVSYGKSAVVPIALNGANINQHSVKITLKENINPFFLSTFFNSKQGKLQSDKNIVGVTRPALDYEAIRHFIIPSVSILLQSEIEKVVNNASKIELKSQSFYNQAEVLLLEELGLKDWLPSTKSINSKSFKESFLATGRLDAEYYQPKYDEIENIILSQKYFKLSDYFDILSNPSPSEYIENGIKVIKTKNIRIPSVDYGSIIDCTTESKLYIQENDLLFASMGVGSLGRISFIDKTPVEKATIDGTIKLFRQKEASKKNELEIPTLLFLSSKVGQELIYKYIIGSTGIISISKENIENLIIPIQEENIRRKLSDMVLSSISLKQQSEHLLEVAKRAVEIAIEQSEDVAMEYIRKNTNESEV